MKKYIIFLFRAFDSDSFAKIPKNKDAELIIGTWSDFYTLNKKNASIFNSKKEAEFVLNQIIECHGSSPCFNFIEAKVLKIT